MKNIVSKFTLLYHTLRYLRPVQVFARGKQIVQKRFPRKVDWDSNIQPESQELKLQDSIPFLDSNKNNSFVFINLEKNFENKVDWDYRDYGMLWAYNLNYFEFLNQHTPNYDNSIRLITDFIDQLPDKKIGLDPYPISLRCINWICFFSRNKIKNSNYDRVLYLQLKQLTGKLEYHLLGNHLLENAFALLFGAYYFNDDTFYQKAKKILSVELEEQILPDGGHFELSPMYHCTMLLRIFDCYNLVSNNNALFSAELKDLLKGKSEHMLGWLDAITFSNGNIPLMNDAAFNIAPTAEQLKAYADSLGIKKKQVRLKESGYRKFETTKFELVADVGSVGPNYQPGHAHADTFNFELHINNRPLIVEAGTSTYEINEVRFYERSTSAHNTVVVDNRNSSQVWSGHRVAKRANVQLLKDDQDLLYASHDGYTSLNVLHKRKFEKNNEQIVITDEIGNGKGVAYLHFAPDEHFEIEGSSIKGKDYTISINGADSLEVLTTKYAPGFNKRVERKSLRIVFNSLLETKFN